jgi:hypothetical protein
MAVRQHGCARAPLAIGDNTERLQHASHCPPAARNGAVAVQYLPGDPWQRSRDTASFELAGRIERTQNGKTRKYDVLSVLPRQRVPASSWSSPARSDGVFWHAGCLGTRMCA